ncbi:MAG: hypothetical protein ACFNL7_02330, partial [Capnocytophaga granulosa]
TARKGRSEPMVKMGPQVPREPMAKTDNQGRKGHKGLKGLMVRRARKAPREPTERKAKMDILPLLIQRKTAFSLALAAPTIA